MANKHEPAAARAGRLLEDDRLRHIDMLEALERGICRVEYAEDDGVLLTVRDYTGMLSCDSGERALELLEGRDYPLLVLHQVEQTDAILARWPEYHASGLCRQGAYLKTEPIPEGSEDIRTLDEGFLPFILEHYDLDDEETIRDSLRGGEILGCFVEGRPVGFVGLHPEGSVGMLFVLPEYRRRGLAEAMERRIFNRELARGHVPYGQVFADNAASRILHEKMGVVFSDKPIRWLWKE